MKFEGRLEASCRHRPAPALCVVAMAATNVSKVVGMGSCGVDYLASVSAFPKPDEKVRSEKLEVRCTHNGFMCVMLRW